MKKIELKVQTKETRKLFCWSCSGTVCASLWLLFQVDSLNDDTSSAGLAKMTEDLVIQGLLIGCMGLVLLLASTVRYYFRLGIVPGLYHSTICVPRFEREDFSFSVSPSLYFCIMSSVLLASLTCTLTFTLNLYQNSQLSLLQLASHSSILVLAFNSLKRLSSKIQEIVGVSMMVASSYLLYLDSSFFEFSLEVHGIGFLLIFVQFSIFFALFRAQERLDGHSIAIVSLVFYGFAAFLAFFVLVLVFNHDFFAFDLDFRLFKSSLALGSFFYCFCRSAGNEVSLLFCYPLFGVLFCDRVEFWIKTTVVAGQVLGTLVVVLGDLPFAAFKDCRNESKSELHSPLLI